MIYMITTILESRQKITRKSGDDEEINIKLTGEENAINEICENIIERD